MLPFESLFDPDRVFGLPPDVGGLDGADVLRGAVEFFFGDTSVTDLFAPVIPLAIASGLFMLALLGRVFW